MRRRSSKPAASVAAWPLPDRRRGPQKMSDPFRVTIFIDQLRAHTRPHVSSLSLSSFFTESSQHFRVRHYPPSLSRHCDAFPRPFTNRKRTVTRDSRFYRRSICPDGYAETQTQRYLSVEDYPESESTRQRGIFTPTRGVMDALLINEIPEPRT